MTTMKKTTTLIAATAAILLTGCATGAPEPEPTTVTETAEAPAPETTTETAEPEPEPVEEESTTAPSSDLVDTVLTKVWTETPEADRVSICDGMGLAPDMMIDTFMDEFYAGGDVDDIEIDRQQVEDFFMGKCGL